MRVLLAEEQGRERRLPVNLREMFAAGFPVIATRDARGGVGGALGIGVADRLLMF